MQWWQTDETGNYAGWRYLNANEDQREEYYTLSQLGQILVDENVASVCARYPDDNPDLGELPGPTDAYYMGPYVYTDPGYVLSSVEVFKALDCFAYQACEHDGWRSSEAFAFCESLREAAIEALPGYEDAPWSFDSIPTSAAKREP
jgi:hypothetical protein